MAETELGHLYVCDIEILIILLPQKKAGYRKMK